MLCAEFPYLQYIDLSEIVHVVEAIIIVIRVHWNLSTVFVVSHVLSVKVSPEWTSNQGFGDPGKCPLSLNRSVPSYVNIFAGPDFLYPVWICPLNRGSTVR